MQWHRRHEISVGQKIPAMAQHGVGEECCDFHAITIFQIENKRLRYIAENKRSARCRPWWRGILTIDAEMILIEMFRSGERCGASMAEGRRDPLCLREAGRAKGVVRKRFCFAMQTSRRKSHVENLVIPGAPQGDAPRSPRQKSGPFRQHDQRDVTYVNHLFSLLRKCHGDAPGNRGLDLPDAPFRSGRVPHQHAGFKKRLKSIVRDTPPFFGPDRGGIGNMPA